jgi:hypothetical protein
MPSLPPSIFFSIVACQEQIIHVLEQGTAWTKKVDKSAARASLNEVGEFFNP